MTTIDDDAFDDDLSFGQEGERVVHAWLVQKQNLIVLPLHQFGRVTNPPYIDAVGGRHPATDLVCWRRDNHVQFFGEVKRFSEWKRYFGGQHTGFPKHKYEWYERLARDTNREV